MPSNITPKDFERFLPEERDTIAQGILKYVQFAILFWRWYRGAYASDGQLSVEFKKGTCATGCLGSKVITEGVPDSGEPAEENEDGTGTPSDDAIETTNPELPVDEPPVPPKETPPPGSSNDCCKPVVKKYEEFFFWEPIKNVDLKCSNFNKVVAIRNGSWDPVKFDTGTDSGSGFHNYVARVWDSGATGGGASADSQYGSVGGMGEMITRTQRWEKVSIFIYGSSPNLRKLVEESEDPSYPDIQGGVYYNNAKSHVDFKCKNGGKWGVEVTINNWSPLGITDLGETLRNLEIRFSPFHTLPPGSTTKLGSEGAKHRWPLAVKVGNTMQEQPYLAFINGIRIVMLDNNAGKKDWSKPYQLGDDFNRWAVLLDERWQNENPCYQATTVPAHRLIAEPSAYAPLWTTDGIEGGMWHIYPESVPNEWPLTDSSPKYHSPKP
jgi:hypothetical protein